MHTNLTAVFEGCNLVYPEMKKRGGGKIIMIGSMASYFGFGISGVYSASKGAIVQYAKSLASAWGEITFKLMPSYQAGLLLRLRHKPEASPEWCRWFFRAPRRGDGASQKTLRELQLSYQVAHRIFLPEPQFLWTVDFLARYLWLIYLTSNVITILSNLRGPEHTSI
jgi:NAD(P)-dependent dehydrogenase (short-subunit alcohol dehydrogenase family)